MGCRRLLFAVALAIAGTAPIAGENLLVNPSFDADVSGWENPFIDRIDWIAGDGNPAGSGGGCMEIADNFNNGGSTGAIQEVAVTPTTDFELSGWVRIPAGSVAVQGQLWVQWYDASDNYLGNSQVLRMPDLSGAWNRVVAIVTSPAEAVTARVRPSFATPSGGTEESITRWDDLFFGESALFFFDGFESGDTSTWSGAVP